MLQKSSNVGGFQPFFLGGGGWKGGGRGGGGDSLCMQSLFIM